MRLPSRRRTAVPTAALAGLVSSPLLLTASGGGPGDDAKNRSKSKVKLVGQRWVAVGHPRTVKSLRSRLGGEVERGTIRTRGRHGGH